MPAINQRIPNFIGGVSQQPDLLKYPGQVRVCDNAVPDVTFGLTKRPPGEFVKTLTNANNTGYWYEILRDGDEKYLVQITPGNTGSHPIRVWNLLTGVEQSMTNSSGDALYAYLSGATSPYAVQTLQDYTLITNPQKTVDASGVTAEPLNSGDYAFARLDTIAYNTEYTMYTGTTAPTPNTYWRATALEVTKNTNSPTGNNETGNTWNDTNKDAKYSGLFQFSFTGGNNITVPGSNPTIEDLEGHITVNGTAYIHDNTANYSGSDFLGYTQVYYTRYTATVAIKDGGLIKTNTKADALAAYIDVDLEGVSYRIKVQAVEPVETYEGVAGIAFYRSPKNPDKGKLSMATILQKMHTSINASLSNVTSEVIGSGLYLYGSAAPTVNFLGGAVNENMNIIGNTAQDVSRLPSQCKHGYIAQVANSESVDADNYYVEFLADNGTQGTGKWEECVRPHNFSTNKVTGTYTRAGTTITVNQTGHPHAVKDKVYIDFTSGAGVDGVYEVATIATNSFTVTDTTSGTISSSNCTVSTDYMLKGLDPATMPHALVNNRNGTFSFKKLDETTADADGNDNYWKYRGVGDDITNPFPSFKGLNIQKIFFHRNRLGLIANEQVVLSRPGDYFNFSIVSAITFSDDNPIDITVSDVKPAFVNHIVPHNKGVIIFSDNGQFILFTESDVFSPKTARLKKVSGYECDASLQPVDMGTSVMFTSNVSAYTRTYESTILDDDVPPQVVEQTRVVPEFIPKDITTSTVTTSLGIVSFGKKNSSDIYHYKYFDTGDRRDQSAWYSWTLTGTMQHMLYSAGSFYCVTLQGSDYILNRHEYVTDATSTRTYVLGGAAADVGSSVKTARWFEACLDNMVIPTAITYTAQGASVTGPDFTDLTIPYTPTSADNFYVVGLSGNDTDGNAIAGQVIKADSVGSNKATFHGVDMTGWTVACGYRYTTTIEFPNYYFSPEANVYDADGELRISGMNFEMGVSGPIEFHLSSNYADMDDYVQYEPGMRLDDSDFGKPPSTLSKTVRVPIQKKNEKYKLQLKVPDPFSTAIVSASWDGRYNTKRHVRT